MRTDIRLNYSQLDSVSKQIKGYTDALADVEDALGKLKEFLADQESEAIKELKEKLDDANIDLKAKKNTLGKMQGVLKEYIQTMEGLVAAETDGVQTRVDYPDIWANLEQIKWSMNSFTGSVAYAVPSGYGSFPSYQYSDYGDAEAAEQAAQEAAAESQKQERNYRELDNFRSGHLNALATRTKNQYAAIKKIYKNYLKKYEEEDDKYRRKLDRLYASETSWKDKLKNFWDDFTKVTGAFLKALLPLAALAVIIFLVPQTLIVLAAAGAASALGTVVMMATPEEYVPDWLSEQKKGAEEFKEKLKDPVRFVEDIGQGFMDDVQTPEGVAAKAGEVTGTALVMWTSAGAGKKLKAKKTEVERVSKGTKGRKASQGQGFSDKGYNPKSGERSMTKAEWKELNRQERLRDNLKNANSRDLSPIDNPVDITDFRNQHILNRHSSGTGKPGKTEFPESWDRERTLHNISDVATDPKGKVYPSSWGETKTYGKRDGIVIRIDFYGPNSKHAGKITTSYPINVPANPGKR